MSTPATSRGSMQFQVLKTATQIKLRELNAHEHKLRAHYEALLEAARLAAAAVEGSPAEAQRAQLAALYEGVKELQIVQTKLHPRLQDAASLVDFARSDPWTTRQGVAQQQQRLQREIREKKSLWRHNKLLGALLQESLHQQTAAQDDSRDAEWETLAEAAAGGSGGGVAVLTKEETQAQLEGYFFQPADGVEEDAVDAFLETQVFHRRASYSQDQWVRVRDTLSQVRESLRKLSEDFSRHVKVTPEEVASAVALLLRNAASFTDDVVAFLHDVKRSSATQLELAHVLTIELSNLHEFAWPAEGVPVHFQRGMNGRFRCHLQEEAVPLILFQYVGMKWGHEIRTQFTALLQTLDGDSDVVRALPPSSVEATRRELRGVFTMAALDDGADYDEVNGEDKPTDVSNASKQDLLRLLCVEARYQQAFRDRDAATPPPSVTAVTTDLAFFGPSVSHAAVLACLRFFGVTDDARAIFARYMQIPLVFPGFAAPKAMQRGVSVGRAMTMFLSETLLFVMDFAVRASTGVHLFRRHDDIIFYDTDATKTIAAWEAMQQWAGVVGLKFNMEKSGSVQLQWSPTPPIAGTTAVQFGPAPLPAAPIQWGLLELQSDASVRILQDRVDAFAGELADRLAAATSVFGWINVYNKYMQFFLRNFGNVSPVFGLRHLDDMTATLQRVHRRVFAASCGDVLEALRDRIALSHGELLADTPLPSAWAQWPLELGGLGLFNPFLAVWSLKHAMYEYLTTHHTRKSEPWPKELADWPWREPFSTERESLVTAFRVFTETSQRDGGLAALLKSRAASELYMYTTSDTLPDSSRLFGTRRWNYKEDTDGTWRLRSLHEFLVDTVPTLPRETLQREFKACLLQVQEVEPPSSEHGTVGKKATARVDAEAQLAEVGGGDGRAVYLKWLALLGSEQLMDEFGTVSFFSRELMPAQLIETIKKTSVAW